MKIGIFGAGHMGSAMIRGWLNHPNVHPNDILVKGGSGPTANQLQHELGFQLATTFSEFTTCDIIFLAVKTPVIVPLLESILPVVFSKKIPIVSVSAGVPLVDLKRITGSNYPICQAIPNTPVQINAGLTGVVLSDDMTNKQKDIILTTLQMLGTVTVINDSLIDIFGTLAGCGPAFANIFIEALGDGAVLHGMSRDMAYETAATMLKGTAELLLATGKHPGELKDQVTSPGGTTIKGVAALEKNGFRYATISALDTIMTTNN